MYPHGVAFVQQEKLDGSCSSEENLYMFQNYHSSLALELAVPLNLRHLLKMGCKVNRNILLSKRFFR